MEETHDSIPKPVPKGKRILILEDERSISELYTQALTTAGYSITVVDDGAEGYEEAADNTYDVILLDLMLPNMLGSEILSKLRREEPHLRAKIIVMTNLDLDQDSRRTVQKQADGYFIKADITPHELIEHINKFF